MDIIFICEISTKCPNFFFLHKTFYLMFHTAFHLFRIIAYIMDFSLLDFLSYNRTKNFDRVVNDTCVTEGYYT